jgi:hypothetical protein
MNVEKLNSYLKIYTYLSERNRIILSKNISYLKQNELVIPEKLKKVGLDEFEVYYALDKLSEKEMFEKQWQFCCSICRKSLGGSGKIWELDDTLECDKCEDSSLVPRLVYKVL